MRELTPAARAREAAGWSIERISRHLEIAVSTYTRFERRNHFPYHHAERLAVIFACSVEVFSYRGLGRERWLRGTQRKG